MYSRCGLELKYSFLSGFFGSELRMGVYGIWVLVLLEDEGGWVIDGV